MNICRKQKPIPSLHKTLSFREEAYEFWLTNQGLIGLLIVIICISILIFMIGYAAANGHIHMISSEANTYEHMEEIVLGGR